ncbi:MAG TPA: hypothetical protein PL041_12145 [Melioribacteraceae bacterium]|nr:hypothetical protein [Melioribacteraceae bacterium]
MKAKIFKIYYFYFFLFISLIFIVNCKDEITGTDIDEREIPIKDISYARHIAPIFEFKCNYSGCHADGVNSSYIMTSWSGVTTYPIVIPGNPDNSILVLRITGRVPPVMPPIGSYATPITSEQERGIKTWIKEGAQNN